MRSGAKRYHTATLDTIQQHITFEKATEEMQRRPREARRWTLMARKMRKEDAVKADSDCLEIIQAIRTTIKIVIITMKAITKTTVVVEEAKAEVEAEAEVEKETAEATEEDIKAIVLI